MARQLWFLQLVRETTGCLKDLNSNIPAIKAIFNGHTELARYLYSLTPLEDLTQEKAINGATLCSLAIYNGSIGKNQLFA